MTVMQRHHADFHRRQRRLYQAPHIAEGLIPLHRQMNFVAVGAREVVGHDFTGFHRFGVAFLQ